MKRDSVVVPLRPVAGVPRGKEGTLPARLRAEPMACIARKISNDVFFKIYIYI